MDLTTNKGRHWIGLCITDHPWLPELTSSGVNCLGNRSNRANTEGITFSIGYHIKSGIGSSSPADGYSINDTRGGCGNT